ncbi:MAG: hypothetical protein ACD_63C00060G0009 [uncultured bacterium]|nr:MAG: hypothetical protein ACD_63C00060G0009 [uncultured bacterium]
MKNKKLFGDKASTYFLLKEAKKAGVKVITFDEKCSLYIFQKGGKSFFVQDHVPDINSYLASKVVNDKALVKRILSQFGIPVPNGIEALDLPPVLEMIDKGVLKFPLVVKPKDGSQGNAVTADIKEKKRFMKAVEEVFEFNRKTKGKPGSFLVENYISGGDYRFLVLDGKVLTVLLRKPAYVVGDGVKNIDGLIGDYNSRPGVGNNYPLCPILRDFEVSENLRLQGLSESSVIPDGEKIVLRKNANISTGGRSFECTDEVHGSYKKLALKVAKILKLRLCAVDLISQNIGEFKDFAVIEINNVPAFDIHEVPYRGKPFPVAKHLIRAMFE